VSLPQTLVFTPGDDLIDPAAFSTLDKLTEVLREIPNDLVVVGHADAVPIHNRRFRNNWDLAASRGLRLLELLNTKFGIDESRLSAESYGSRDPKTSNDSQDGRASNRRVEILILSAGPI
jgi:chemotaxis protein MotB